MSVIIKMVLLILVISCGRVERPNDILNDITGATKAVESYDKHKDKISKLKIEVSDLVQDIINLNLTFGEKERLLNNQLISSAKRIDALISENDTLTRTVKSLSTSILYKEKQLEKLEATNEDLEDINNALIDENGYLKNKVRYLSRYKRHLLSTYLRLWYEVRCLRNTIIDKDIQIKSLKFQVSKLQDIVDGYKDRKISIYMMDILNSGVKQLVIKFKNGSYIKLKNKHGNSSITSVDDVILLNSKLR